MAQPKPSDYGYNPDGGLSSSNLAAGKKYRTALSSWNASQSSAPQSTPQTTPQSTPQNSQQTVWKDGKSTVILASEMQDYLSQGYTQQGSSTVPPPIETPTEISTEVLQSPITTEDIQAQVSSPVEGIQQVFGPDWQPPAIFEQLGLTEQGIHGAVRIKGMNDVYTIGTGGGRETAESYLEKFGTSEQQGIVGEISMEEAKALGITIGAESILEPINQDPYSVWENFRDEDKAEIDTMRAELKTATQSLIDTLKDFGEDKADAKDDKKEELGIDEKDKAIADAEKVYADAMEIYSKVLLKNRSTSGAMSRILGTESRVMAQRAIEMAPLSTNILIAQNSYNRAKEQLDEWNNDYNTAMQFQMQAAQMNIDMLQGDLNREQAENLQEAQIKFDMWQTEYNANLQTQEEVKKLIMMYNDQGAGININDSWEDAYRKASVYIGNELQFERDMKNLDKQLKQKSLNKPYYAPSSTTKDVVSRNDKSTRANVVGIPNYMLDDILHSKTPPPWFNEQMSEEHQQSRASWQTEWDKERQPVVDVYFGEENSWKEYTDTEMRKLRQAGLKNASQQEKDDYLYGKSGREA